MMINIIISSSIGSISAMVRLKSAGVGWHPESDKPHPEQQGVP